MKKLLKNIFGIILIFVIYNFLLGMIYEVNAASVSVSNGTVTEGNNITINFNISGADSGYQGKVSYDTSKLEFVSYSFSTSSNLNSYNAGSVASVLGSSFSIVFKAKSSGTADISFNNILLGDGSSLSGASGKVTINAIQSTPTTSEVPSQTTPETPTQTTPEPTPTTSQPNTNNSSQAQAPSTQQPTEKEPTFKSVNDTVYATKSMNVRSSWSTSSSKIGGLSKNQAVTRTGIGDNGWSRIKYNGQIAYVSTSLITTTKPVEDKPEENIKPEEEPEEEKTEEITQPEETEVSTTEDNTQENIEENDNPIEDEEKDNDQIYEDIVTKVGTIPEVGKNYNIYIFFMVCLISIISIIAIFKKI